MQDIPQENQPVIKQSTSIVDGKVFITTQKIQKDINGKEFVILETTQPYNGSIEDYKTELQNAKELELERHNELITDIDTKIEVADTVIIEKPTPTLEDIDVDKGVEPAKEELNTPE